MIPPLTVTGAVARVVLSTSAVVMPEAMTTGVEVTLAPSTKAVSVPAPPVRVGVSLTAVMLTVWLTVPEARNPSATKKVTERGEVSGLSEVLV